MPAVARARSAPSGRRLDDLARRAARGRGSPPWLGQEPRPAPPGRRPRRTSASAASSRPSPSNQAGGAWWRSRISSAGSGSRASVYSRISPCSAYQPRSPGSGWRNSARFASSVERRRRVRARRPPEQRRREPVEVDRAPDQRPGRLGGAARRPPRRGRRRSGPPDAGADRGRGLAVAAGRAPVGLEREPDGRRPAARRARGSASPRRRAGRRRRRVVAEQGVEQLAGSRRP